MMKHSNIHGILAATGGYIASVIGAGFASGQEIVSFFVKYGKSGIFGIAISCIFFSVFAWAVLSACVSRGIHGCGELLDTIFTAGKTRRIMRGAAFVCSASTLCVMTACAGEICSLLTDTGQVAGAAALIIVCGVILFMDARKILGINSVLGGVITIGIIFSCFYIMRYREHQTFSLYSRASLSGFSYAGYNLIGTCAVLAGLSRFIRDSKEAAISAAASGIALFIMITLIWIVLSIYYGHINLGEIPMLTMTFRQSRLLGYFYTIMLCAAVLTTAVSSGFAVTDILCGIFTVRTSLVLTLLIGFCFSSAGFSVLIDSVYKICGYAGIILSVIIIVKCIKRRKSKKNIDLKSKRNIIFNF